MKFKKIGYASPEDLIDETKLSNVRRAWKSSIVHQITEGYQPEADEIITSVAKKIKNYLPHGE